MNQHFCYIVKKNHEIRKKKKLQNVINLNIIQIIRNIIFFKKRYINFSIKLDIFVGIHVVSLNYNTKMENKFIKNQKLLLNIHRFAFQL